MALKKNVFVEAAASKYDVEKVMKDATADFKSKNKNVTLKDIKVYIKPEDGKAYYTANSDKITGVVSL